MKTKTTNRTREVIEKTLELLTDAYIATTEERMRHALTKTIDYLGKELKHEYSSGR